MIRLGQKSTIAFVAGWLAVMFLAFKLGERSQVAAATRTHSDAPAVSSISALANHSTRTRTLNQTRRTGVENRFIDFTQQLAGDELSRLLPEITDKMSLAQVEAVLKRLMEEVAPGPARRVARFKLIRRWAQLDPKSALDHVAALHDPKLRHDLHLEGLEGWSSVDPAAALAFVLDAENGSREESRDAVRAGFATMRNLDRAFAFASTLGSETTPDPQWSAAMAVEALFQNNDLAVIRWVEDLPDGPLREEAVTGLLGQWARHDPAAAREWLDKHADPATLARHRELIDKLAAHAP